MQITGPPAPLLAPIGVLVFLYPFSPWWPQSNSGAAPIPSARAIDLPAPDQIYNRPVDEATQRLNEAGLVVREGDIGCSNSTEPGSVRQVTLGSLENVHILYGKVSDDIDEAAVRALNVGDEVTVWTPSSNPCP